MKKTVILGMGKSGQAAALLLKNKGVPFLCFDDKLSTHPYPALDPNVALETVANRLIVSPGIGKNHPLYERALKQGIEIMNEVELALSYLNQPMVAITGTNGKTTVTLLVEHILKTAGKKAKAVGNVGIALSDYALNPDPEEILSVELSSFQLELMKQKKFDAAIILNITPDHLDRYSSMEHYAESKMRVQTLLKEEGISYVYEDIFLEFSSLFKAGIPFGKKKSASFWTDKKALYHGSNCIVSLPAFYEESGQHDSENALAAWLLISSYQIPPSVFYEALTTFKKPKHRIEFVASVAGVSYFDDSKGTNIDAVIQAVAAMKEPTILIAGGVDKGFPYTSWEKALASKVKKIVTIGQAAGKIERDLGHLFAIENAENMEEAVEKATACANQGDCVLLSPGCSSYDMFQDYAHRGREFQRCVLNLQNRRKST